MVNDVGRLVAAISIDDLVLVAQNVGAGADAATVVRFHAVGRVGWRGRGIRQPVQVPRRGLFPARAGNRPKATRAELHEK